jgi:hypothetical protein
MDRGLSFAALLCPAGVHVVAYRRSRAGLQVERYARELRSGLSAEEVGRVLANLLESEGARGQRVSIAVTGFGSCHQILTLPRAGRGVLQPIVIRELRRFYPDLFAKEEPEPLVDFVELDSTGESPSPQNDLLVAAVPRAFLQTVVGALAARGMRVDHWTVAPRALQRLYDAFSAEERTGAALIMVPGWPLLGFFHDHELRLFSEPRSGPGTTFDAGIGAAIEHVERGAIFLRQQFRGATVSQLYLAAGPNPEHPEGAELLGKVLGLTVRPFGPGTEEPGAFAALGAALDAAGGQGLNLLPPALRPPSGSDRWTRRLAVASACILLLAAGWWAWSARRAETALRAEIAALTGEVTAESSVLSSVRPIIEERRSHAQRAAIIEMLSRDRRRLPEVLWPLEAAARDVEVRKLHVAREENGWAVDLSLTATAMSYEQATDAITAVTQQLGAELPDGALTVSGIELKRALPPDSTRVETSPEPIAASVEMSFIIPAVEEASE